nr:MAG TPA: DNA-directed RNA polymerase [Caudoviricetes sp.]
MQTYRCPRCNKRLFDAEELKTAITIVCTRCKTTVTFNYLPSEKPERESPIKASEPSKKPTELH